MRAHAAVVALLVLPLAACGGGLSNGELVSDKIGFKECGGGN